MFNEMLSGFSKFVTPQRVLIMIIFIVLAMLLLSYSDAKSMNLDGMETGEGPLSGAIAVCLFTTDHRHVARTAQCVLLGVHGFVCSGWIPAVASGETPEPTHRSDAAVGSCHDDVVSLWNRVSCGGRGVAVRRHFLAETQYCLIS